VFAKKCINRTLKDLRFESIATGRRHLLQGVSMEGCKFDSVLLAKPFRGWHEFGDVHAVDCCFRNCLVKQARLTRVTLHRCEAPAGGIVLWKCILDQVTFDGVYESLRILPPTDHEYGASNNDTFIVDIRTATCVEIELLGIPPPLVRFDRATAAVLSRDVLDRAGWPIQSVSDYLGGIMIKFRSYGGPASVYAIPTGAKDAPALIAELAVLRERGWLQ